MTLQLRLALAALGLLVAVAAAGMFLGSRRADPSAAEPDAPMLDVSTFRSVALLPPEQRGTWLQAADFERPPVADPRLGAAAPASGSGPAAQSAAANASSQAMPAGTRSYRIRERDSLTKIARREYGSESHWRWLAQVNGIENPGKLKIGDVIQLPPRPAAASAAPAAAPGTAPAAAPQGRRHVVQKGETAGGIAQRYYGTSKDWRRILEANGLKRAEDLRAGQTLLIP